MSETKNKISPKQVKVLLVLIDGIGDLQLSEFDNQTCLQKANLPIFDALSQSGINGLMDPVETGLSCGSDTAHMNIFGYNPFKEYRGRGSFETMGAGQDMEPNEIAFKCNFAHMDKDFIVKKRRVDRNFPEWGLPLIDTLDNQKIKNNENYQVCVKHATEHRCGVKVKCNSGENQLSSYITGTDPLKDNLKLRTVVSKVKNDPKSTFTANLINDLSNQIHEILEENPINKKRKAENKLTGNIVLLRGCGERLNVDTFEKKHGKKSFMIAPTAIIRGLGQTIGMDIIEVEGTTGYYDSNLNNKATSAFQQFSEKNYDFGFLHIKAVDDAGHDKNQKIKVEQLEKVNKMFEHMLQLEQNQDQEIIIALTGDHTTPVIYGDHTFEPVPVAITTLTNLKLNQKLINKESICPDYFQKVNCYQDKVEKYSEIDGGYGVLGRFPACELLKTLFKIQEQLQPK